MRKVFRKDNEVHIFRLGTTTNKKICSDSKEKIIQTYVFSKNQYEYVASGGGSLKDFFAVADSNCLDCPMRSYGKCYTHKFTQARGFLSMLRSIAKDYNSFNDLPTYSESIKREILDISRGKYIRFGTYGEPVLHGIDMVTDIVDNAKTWTGYTHQWITNRDFNKYFMASVHTDRMEQKARGQGWKSFITIKEKVSGYVNCPASKESGFKSSCDKCGLCSGMKGKGKKSVFILEH